MADRKSPETHRAERSSTSAAKWFGIAFAVIIVLLLLAWIIGGVGGGEPQAEAAEAPIPVQVLAA